MHAVIHNQLGHGLTITKRQRRSIKVTEGGSQRWQRRHHRLSDLQGNVLSLRLSSTGSDQLHWCVSRYRRLSSRECECLWSAWG